MRGRSEKDVENDGYEAVQIGFGDQLKHRGHQAYEGHFAKNDVSSQESTQRVPS
jgi:large subunit ribosomal protein L3